MTTEADDRFLGYVDHVGVSFVRTSTPWSIGADTLVVSVGTILGSLGSALVREFPHLWRGVEDVNTARIRPFRPVLLDLKANPADCLRWLVLASPHDRERSEATATSVRRATENAILMAGKAGATAIAVPLIGTGDLGLPKHRIAKELGAMLAAMAGAFTGWPLRRIVFFDPTADVSADLAARLGGRPDQAMPDPDHPGRVSPGPGGAGQGQHDPAPDPEPVVEADLAGGVSSDLVDPSLSIPMGRDRLGFAPYASMLAEVVSARETPTPLSIGVFGEWGSGKSFFMGMLRGRIAELADSGSPRYCGRVVQIGFNAWHYADTNLWASLGDVIFRALAEPEPAGGQRSELQQMLAERVDRRAELVTITSDFQAEVARQREAVERARQVRVTGIKEVIGALRRSEVFRARLRSIGERMGVSEQVEQTTVLARRFNDTRADADAVRALPATRRGRTALAVAALLSIVSSVLFLVQPLITWLGGAVAALLASTGVGLMVRAQTALGDLRALGEDVRDGLDLAAEERAEVAAALEKVREAEAEQLIAQAELDEVVAHVAGLHRRLAELNPARRMTAFVADRTGGDSYTRGLGVVSLLRKDFELLVRLLADWRAEPGADPTARPIDRIVLHIDDLDRCEPRQVVQVLEAVHLLLAMDLFVVVVGVDPRWLVRSLRRHYSDLLDSAETATPGWRVTPEDYLEKIINIPFALPAMAGGTLGNVLRSMVDRPRPTGSAPVPTPAAAAAQPPLEIEPGAELAPAPPSRRPPDRPLTDGELALLDCLDTLIRTPRAAKRLFNLYRMIRATRDLSDAADFLGGDDSPGQYQAVVVLLGIVVAAPTIVHAVFHARPVPGEGVLGGLLHRPPELTWAEFAAGVDRSVVPREGAEQLRWTALSDGLRDITAEITLTDLTAFHLWAPRVHRFSYAVGAEAL